MSKQVPRPSSRKIQYVAKQLENYEDWIVEAIDYYNGCSYLTVFEGKFAEPRAKEYAAFKNAQLSIY